MQSTFKIIRKKIFNIIFEIARRGYVVIIKRNKKEWSVNRQALLQYPKQSFGYEYGMFLQGHDFEILSKIERHDAYHVITNYNVDTVDEIALQYLCIGNGKRDFYAFGIIILGSLLFPEYWKYYFQSYQVGKKANTFHHWNFEKLLDHPLADLKTIIFSKNELSILNLS